MDWNIQPPKQTNTPPASQTEVAKRKICSKGITFRVERSARTASADASDVTSIRFSARKAKTAAARTATISKESYPRIRSHNNRSWSVDRYPEKARTIHLKAIRNGWAPISRRW